MMKLLLAFAGAHDASSSYARPGCRPRDGLGWPIYAVGSLHMERVMGKYLIGWMLGIPAIVLVIAYFFFG
jgi:hypothetical protein